ncbi:hypothetical protein ACFL4T_07960 [candidate division KSB1 bacterium]
MTKKFFLNIILILITSFCFSQLKLEKIYNIELKRLEETWNILDQYADKICEGWNGFAEVPFLFVYPNGVKLLVGHPKPPVDFKEVEGITVKNKKVYIDRSKEISLKLEPPLLGGGSPIFHAGSRTVWIRLMNTKTQSKINKENEENKHLKMASENQILMNIHELFHCHQSNIVKLRYGSLRYNPDLNYAVYSDIEGKALEKAYFEKDDEKSKEYLKDFIIARELKRKSMTEHNQGCESADDFREGTAVYSVFQALLCLKENYIPILTNETDPYFFGFKNIDYFINEKIKSLKENQDKSLISKFKCYHYGCFQAILLSRLFPGWIEESVKENKFLDEIISGRLNISEDEKETIVKRININYDSDSIFEKHKKVIDDRDLVLEQWKNKKGKVYILNFQPTGEYLIPEPRGKSYSDGSINLYPEGIKELKIYEISLTSENTLIEKQMFHIRWIDENSKSGEKGYSINYEKKEGENIFLNAEVKTGGFTLRAPKVEVKEGKKRVKFNVLSKIKLDL